jgi:hypothetical protein
MNAAERPVRFPDGFEPNQPGAIQIQPFSERAVPLCPDCPTPALLVFTKSKKIADI